MLARSVPRCATKLRLPASRTRPRYAIQPCRRYSTPASGAPTTAQANVGMLAPFCSELDRIAPSFKINGSQICVLQTPAEFYETLKIATLQDALRRKPDLKLSILTDALRGAREAPDPSCASLLAPLVAEFGPDRVELRMYHTPNLAGLRKQVVPKRINEGWGLQHMKLYGVDDEIILSGANLSTDYFTNRQDRYHLFSSKQITDYFLGLHNAVSSLSFRVTPSDDPSGFEMSWPATNAAPSPLENPKGFISGSTALLGKMLAPSSKAAAGAAEPPDPAGKNDTSVYVLAQLSQLLSPDSSTELPAITHVLKTLSSPQYADSSWTFTAGYFNPAPSLTKLLLSTASHNNTVITASPYANGFYGSPGVSGLLPDAYTLLARRFVRAVHQSRHQATTALKEWQRGTVGQPGGWTYHAKGLWVTLPGETAPSLSLVGSSNYTKRSYSLDLEANALIVTRNEGLRSRLGEEQRWLQEHAAVVTRDDFAKTERRVGLKVRIAMWIVQLVGGAL